ncbi:hypothetical protein SAMN04488518_1185 [Pseudovibrio ascidiaceicola]|uniref:DUF6538 domain-containing protein n=1 Tax=Pseudovibrio ascidiaceicola TaxID=285279 RepID=A0A1I4F9N5_9HYPH|nr:DUF6538 domain-containing protein [Pseudovibrio ascidiaceicola]SFL14239.1 hypothetical protein SAMN04488518_1185 [Pseudovibrio ascidiaceicola]
MAHTISRGMYYFVKRVPKRFASVDLRSRTQLSLKTQSPDVAQKKSLIIEERLAAYWEALLAEDHEGAKAHYEAVVNFAEVQGMPSCHRKRLLQCLKVACSIELK